MNAFEWANASSIQNAVALLKPANPKADADEMPRPMGGGQDLLTTMKEYLVRPPRVVNLKTIAGLNAIKPDGKGGLTIGATVTVTEVQENSDVKRLFPGLAQAASLVATPQIRNIGTIGGNLCQRPRCWYFRLENVKCLKKGGDTCYSAEGQNKYNAIFDTGPSKIVHPSDLATILTALNATLTIMGPAGPRTIPVESFFITPDKDVRHENILQPDEIVTEIQIPATSAKSTYLKFKERESLDFAVAAVAAVVDFAPDKTVRACRLVLGGVASIPWRVPEAEKFLTGKPINPANVDQVATLALAGAKPLAMNGYKVPLTQALLRRALNNLNA